MDNTRNKKEAINHPEHYSNGKVECIDAMEATFGYENVAVFCHLNAFKYLWRAGKKGDFKEDVKKALWYLNKELELYEKDVLSK